ncbi:hypothetical protein SNK03_008158 [Fusarium graminearum]
MKLFLVALLSAALDVPGEEGFQLVSYLLRKGANPNSVYSFQTPLRKALRFQRTVLHEDITPLQLAVRSENLDIARQLLQAGANPDGTIACEGEEYGTVKVLLEAGAGVDTRNIMQSTALQCVCGSAKNDENEMKTVKLLLEWGADVDASPGQENGKSSIEAAAGTGDIDMVKLLLRKGATCNNPTLILQAAFRSGSMELVNFLRDHFSKAGLFAVGKADNWSQYLETATKSRNTQLVNMILSLCVDKSTGLFEKHVIDAMEVVADRGYSTMLYSLLMPSINPSADGRACRILSKSISEPLGIWEQYAKCFTLLMDKFAALGLDLDKPLPGDATPLCIAIAHVKAESNAGILARVIAETCENGITIRWDALAPVVSLLLDAGADVNAIPTENYPMTALQYAINANYKELITILLNAGADIYAHAFWKGGKTTLQAACYGGNLELVQSLVVQGVDINAQPALHYGATALQFAAMQGHLKIAIFLLENGALINAPAALVEGQTALQGAVEHGRLDMIYLLLENDQDDGLEERCQQAAKFAEVESRFEIAQLLREYRKVWY